MVSASDIRFWTSLEVTEEDASRFSSAVLPVFLADGGEVLIEAVKTEAMCYLIAAAISNRSMSSGKVSESLGGYSYTRKSPASSSYWMDLYHELMSSLQVNDDSAPIVRTDLEMMEMNRRFSHGVK